MTFFEQREMTLLAAACPETDMAYIESIRANFAEAEGDHDSWRLLTQAKEEDLRRIPAIVWRAAVRCFITTDAVGVIFDDDPPPSEMESLEKLLPVLEDQAYSILLEYRNAYWRALANSVRPTS